MNRITRLGNRRHRHWVAVSGQIVLLAVLIAGSKPCPAAPVQEGEDPFCGTPNRLKTIQAARAELIRKLRLEGRRGLSLQDYTPTSIGLSWDPAANRPHLFLRAPAGRLLQVDSAPALEGGSWQPWLTVGMTSDRLEWLDSSAGSVPGRYYRLTPLPDGPFIDSADDFVLLDQAGKAHELFYPTDLKAVVIAAAGNSGPQFGPTLMALKSLAQTSGVNGIQYWLLLNDPAVVRTNVADQVEALGIDLPVLLDPNGLGIRALKMTHAGEVVVVQPPAFTVAYRGELEMASNGPPTQSNVAAAITKLVQTQPLTFLRTPATGPLLAATATEIPSYAREIAPIFHDHCAICHRSGDVAPFALTNYSVALEWAPVMKHALLTGQMPPWHADPEYGHWTNSLALAAADKSKLLRWIDAGAPRGDGPDPLAEQPPPPSYRTWPAELGEPDALVTVGLQQVKATGIEQYRYLFVQTPNPSNVWLRAAIILPSNPQVVHHYLVWTGQIGDKGLPNLSTYQDSLALYAPGVAPYIYPSDSGYPLGASNWLTFNLHYTPNGQATNDLPTLALWYHKTTPPKIYHEISALNPFFLIQPRDPESPVQAEWTFPNAVRLHRLNPHMHLRGKYARFDAIYPDGTQETLLSVPDYNFRWQNGYEFVEPKLIPAGTHIVVSGAFDNSPQNLANPDPNATVFWGDQTANEMFVGFLDYVE